MNLNPVVNLEFKDFAGATITDRESGIVNGMIDESKGKPVLTQRPSININEIAATAKGRAVYFWDSNNVLYLLNDDTIYKNTYASAIGTTITSGTQKCKFLQLNTLLILIDPQDNKGYTITTADGVTAIGGSFPADIAHGGAILDGYLFVMDSDGTIWNSDLNDASTFSAGNNIDTEREEDGGIYLGKHHDHLIALGERTAEFFYDNANPTNSPLNRREDIAYTIGCADGNSIWEESDTTVFVGSELSTGLSVYVLENFKFRIISNGAMDALLTQSLTRDNYSIFGSGFSANGHKFYIMTIHTTPSTIDPEVTYVYDFKTGLWHEWETTINSLTNFPVIDWSIRAGQSVRSGTGILSNGDVVIVNNTYTPQDTIGANDYVLPATYVDAGYITDTAASGTALAMKVRFGQFDGETNNNKFMHYLRPRMNNTANSQTLTVTWSDNNNDNFITGGTIDTQYQHGDLHRLGRFYRRNIELQYAGTEQLFIESLEVNVQIGSM
jgi:hypothetical protein